MMWLVGEWYILFLWQWVTLVVWVCNNEDNGDSQRNENHSHSVHHYSLADELLITVTPTHSACMRQLNS